MEGRREVDLRPSLCMATLTKAAWSAETISSLSAAVLGPTC